MVSGIRLPALRAWSDVLAVAAAARALVLGAALLLLVCDVPPPSPANPSAFETAAGARWRANPEKVPQRGAHRADFGADQASPEVRRLANWIADSRDNRSLDFLIVDKKLARLYVFEAGAKLRASSPILLGAALGDESVPGIGGRAIADIRPDERITPAGRFLAERGHNARGEDVVWVDYAAAISMHRVLRSNPAEHRLERLASVSLADKRISWGCINVPLRFYEERVRPVFFTRRALIYVLPDIRPVQQVFGSYEVK